MTQALEQTAENDQTKLASTGASRHYFTISDVARTYNVTLRALRFYEDRGLIQPMRQGTTRLYDEAARQRLQTILRGKKLGFTLQQIAAMLSAKEGESLSLKDTEILQQISQLNRKREDIDLAIMELHKTYAAMIGDDSLGNGIAGASVNASMANSPVISAA